jgi:hypothetical protein
VGGWVAVLVLVSAGEGIDVMGGLVVGDVCGGVGDEEGDGIGGGEKGVEDGGLTGLAWGFALGSGRGRWREGRLTGVLHAVCCEEEDGNVGVGAVEGRDRDPAI